MKERKRHGSRSRRVYALLLASYPRGFRREYGREMARVFADLCRESAGRASLAMATLIVGALLLMMTKSGEQHTSSLTPRIIAAQVVSLLVWFAVHLWWVSRREGAVTPATAEGPGVRPPGPRAARSAAA
jgi:hypothetical protein